MLQYCKNRLFCFIFQMEFVSDKTVFRYFIFYMEFVADKMFFDFQ